MVKIKSDVIIKNFKIAFFLFSFIEIYVEFTENRLFQWFTKPFLIPLLVLLYIFSSQQKSSLYIIALLFNWLANILFISSEAKFIATASVFFLIHRVLIIVKIFKDEKSLGLVPIVLGGIPFLFLFLSLINIVYESIEISQFYLILVQTLLMTILGGFSLGNYIIKNTISSKMLMISSLFFGVNLFILGVKIYYIDLTFLKPMSMIFFVLGHYVFYSFMILNEKEQFL